ncbi:hypothetical protein H6G96_04965 [Nostoc sp. FACHB-892]|uniref:calcium-binding protein n=1 Tax=Nostoc sp. FACHB-892 TaxID=2692843 RepID=UPI00168620C2|nr:hypothetical protein [Nostoc sp. FACHB-892]MBD2725685.1 hypothetical protein [Nostoc sp. FACHB-892]
MSIITGTSLNDVLNDTLDNDVINDGIIDASADNDTINAGDGQDTVNYSLSGGVTVLPTDIVQKTNGTDQLISTEKIIGSATAIDTIDASGSNVQLIGDLSVEQVKISNISVFDSLNFQVVNFDKVIAGNGNDCLTGNAGVNTVNGGWGDDNLNGNDILTGGAGSDLTFNGKLSNNQTTWLFSQIDSQ